MSTVQSVNIVTVVFADPYFTPSNPNAASNPAISAQAARTRSSRIDPYLLQNNISFNYPITSNIQTLSSKNADRGNDPYGILFVPDLKSDQCKEKERDFVRANATRLANLPQNLEYPLVAIAPWFSPTCMLEYFGAASVNTAVRTFLVYQPGTSNAMPPVMNDPSWVLGDGGQWKSANQFPTYALDSLSGGIIAGNLSLYSGNITDAPNGSILAPMFQSTDYVRLWATIDVETENQLPSLWVFLVIVLGMLIVVVGTTSGCMHLTQRRRRNNLRRRVINGEVDLEALGVKRLAVPRDYLEKLPLYTYSAAPDHQISDKSQPEAPAQVHNIPSPTIDADTGVKSAPLTRRSEATPPIAPPHGASPTFSQPTCPICLDDFEPNESQVRELPCQHIFHAECIDTFLISNSSLCPMCKKSVLPVGYCPTTITNLMVRRERNIRRIRARAAANNASSASPTQPSSPTTSHPPGAFGSLGSRLGQTAIGRRVFSAPQRNQPRPPDIEMPGASAVPAPADSTAVPPSSVPEITPIAQRQTTNLEGCTESATHNRREWARQRALALLGNRHVPDASDEEPASTSRWRRIFPGFR